MTTNLTTGAGTARTDANLDAARADVKAEISRTDNKASLLLAFVGALLAGVWTVASGRRLPLVSLVIGGAAMLLLATVAGVLLWAVRPNLGGARPVGFPKWATLAPEQVVADLSGDDRAEHIAVLSRIAVRKFTHLRRAVDLTCAAGVLLVIAAVIAVGGTA
ncbi:Pycsar system effector family protein [Streptomyces sp. V4-01]|uniref:Pycsar system effector family protein n=1 Tax=Actinacidiphila polyblastidii TaxID=3110430 RepID=A0ABU7P5T9_9ACTN|nr:Pycsar system effector family protein [Streptomyces sp. V4-01]